MTPRAAREVQLIVRETGERTREACLSVVRRQLPDDRIRVISERPFSRAVRRGLEIGASQRPAWLFTLDADVLLTPTAIADLLALCHAAPDDAFHVKGLLVCRVYGGTQPRGFHAFRGPLLDEALGFVGLDPQSTRPETSVVRRMEQAGHRSVFAGHILGLHDYEQSLRHLYIKALLRARKTDQLDSLKSRLAAKVSEHPDFLVSLWGLEDARASDGAELDWDAPQPRLEVRLREADLRDKGPLVASSAPSLVEEELSRFASDRTALSFPRVAPGDPPLHWPLSA